MWQTGQLCRKVLLAGAGAAVRSASSRGMHMSAASAAAAATVNKPALLGAMMQIQRGRNQVVDGIFSRKSSAGGCDTQFRMASSSPGGGGDDSEGETELDVEDAEDAEELEDLGEEVAAAEAAEAAVAAAKRPILWKGRASDAVGMWAS